MKRKSFGFLMAALAILALALMWHISPMLSLPLFAFGALTARISADTGSNASDQIISIGFSDTTGGTGAVSLTCGGLETDKLTSKTDKFAGWFGEKAIRKTWTLDACVMDVKTASTEQFLADLESKIVAYVKVTYADGVTKTLDSGTTGIPVMNFIVDWENKDKALGWHIVGTGKVGILTTTP